MASISRLWDNINPFKDQVANDEILFKSSYYGVRFLPLCGVSQVVLLPEQRLAPHFPVGDGTQAKSVCNFQLPKPYVFGGTIGLVDIGGNPSGNVNITLRITCRGKYVLGSYVLEEGCFLFKDDAQGTEFRVERLHKAEEMKESENREYASIKNEVKDEFLPEIEEMTEGINWENYVRDVGAIFPSAGSLSLGKPPRKRPRTPLAQAEIKIEIVTKKGTEKMKKRQEKEKKKKKNKEK